MVARSSCIRSYALLGDQISRSTLEPDSIGATSFSCSSFFLTCALAGAFRMAFFLVLSSSSVLSKRSENSNPNKSLIFVLSSGITIVLPTVAIQSPVCSRKRQPSDLFLEPFILMCDQAHNRA
jgi:hypothetical protein